MKAFTHQKFLPTLVLGVAVGIVGCSGDGTSGGQGGDNAGGSVSSGGAAGSSSGGTTAGNSGTASGGAGGATLAPSTCTEPDITIAGGGNGKHCGYEFENWVDAGSGSATLVLKADGFGVTWNKINNFVGRKGIRPGSGDLVTTFEANYQPNGNSYLCVYGWTKNPLIEYYVVDAWGSWKPPGGTSIGTLTSDGGTYDIYKMQRVNQPSIEGNSTTFFQYWSVRQQKRTSGTITLANHIAAWASKGLNLGSFYEVSMTVEGYQSSGTADVKFSIK